MNTYIPIDDNIKDFFKFSPDEKNKIIRLGLLLYQDGIEKIQFWNDNDWNDKFNLMKKQLNDKINTSQNIYEQYISDSQIREKKLIEEIKYNEQLRYQNDIEHLTNTNYSLSEKYTSLLNNMQNLHNDFDNKLNKRLLENRQFYEDKLSRLESKLEDVRKEYEHNILSHNTRNNNSTIKGQEGEEFVFAQLNMMFPKAEIEDTHHTPGRGDFILREDNLVMMVETKNYTKNVQKSEIDKFYRDIDNTANSDIHCAIFVSLNTGICCKNDFEFEVRNLIPILFIHNLNDNFSNIILAVKFFKLITNKSKIDFTNQDIIDNFKNLSTNIKRNFNKQKNKLDKFHTEQISLISDQELRIIELYNLVNIKL